MSPDVIDRWWSPNDEATASAGIGSSHVTRSGLPLAAHRDVIRSTHLQRSAPPPSVIIYTIPASRRVASRRHPDGLRPPACMRPQPLKGRLNATRLPAETLDLCCRASSSCCSTYVTRLTTKPLHADRAHMHHQTIIIRRIIRRISSTYSIPPCKTSENIFVTFVRVR